MKHTFLWLHVELVIKKYLEDTADNEDIVQVYKDKNTFSKYGEHH